MGTDDGTFQRLQAGDAEVVQEPTDQPYGVRDCAFRDPAGHPDPHPRAALTKEGSMSAQKATTKSRKSTTTARGKTVRLTAEERAAMKAYLKEQKAAAQGADMLRELLDRIAEMPAEDRSMAKRIHEIVTTAAPSLEPRTWYGMPAYAKDGKVICFFQSAEKFKARYATFGFNDAAKLDSGAMWPTSFALKELTAKAETKIRALVKKAVG